MLQVKLVKSPIGNTKRNRATVAALGLRKMHQTVVLPDNESIRGMIFKVKHMLAVEVVEGGERKASTPKRARTGTGKAEAPKSETAKSKPVRATEAKSPAPETEQAEKPKAEAKPKSQSKPKSDAKPKAAAKPKAVAKPKTTAKKKEQ